MGTGQENYGTQNQSNVEQKQQNTDHTRPKAAARDKKEQRKEDLGLLIKPENWSEMVSEQLPRCFEGP